MIGVSFSTTNRLGDLLLERKLLTPEQLQSAVREQSACSLQLGEILIRNRLLTKRQVRRCLRWQKVVRLAALVTTFTVGPAMVVQAFDSGERYRYLQSLESMELEYTPPASESGIQRSRVLPQQPVFNQFKGEYSAGVTQFSEGVAYRLQWAGQGLGMQLHY